MGPLMAKRKTKKKKLRTIACKHLVQLNQISNAGNPLCHCDEREFTISPFNFVCQVCALYTPNSQNLTHDQMYTAEGAEGFEINWEEIEIDEEDDDEEEVDEDIYTDADEFDEELLIDKKKFKKEEVEEEDEEEEDEDEEEEEVFEEEEEEALVIGLEKEKTDEDLLEYEDEREEALGKKASGAGIEDEDELESELEDLEDELGFEETEFEGEEGGEIDDEALDTAVSSKGPKSKTRKATKPKVAAAAGTIDFEKDVVKKIKKIEKKGEKREVCPFCGKDYKSVLRHVYRCKRAPAGIEAAYEKYKKKH